MKTAILYWSKTGNTAKVAETIQETLVNAGVEVIIKTTNEANNVDFYAYDLLCLGFPAYRWSPPKPVDKFLQQKFNEYRKQGCVKLGSPKMPGKHVLIFCTYSGPHTGINEAIPAGKYAGQFFDHLGFTIVDEWYVVGEFHGSEANSTKGRLGDIRGRPNVEDLETVRQKTHQLLIDIG